VYILGCRLAQAIHESDGGEATPKDVHSGQESYNLFGYKGSGSRGSVQSWTWEVVNNQKKKVLADFRAYDSIRESVKDYGKLLANSGRYAEAFNFQDDPKKFISKVRQGGYATDPSYTEKVTNIMEQYNLTDYDDTETKEPQGFWGNVWSNLSPIAREAWDMNAGTPTWDQVEEGKENVDETVDKAKKKVDDIKTNWTDRIVEPIQDFFDKVTSRSFGVSASLVIVGIVVTILALYSLFISGGSKTIIETQGGGASE